MVDKFIAEDFQSAVPYLMMLIAYLLGSISPAIIIGKMNGIDIREQGSKNAGTTNVLRVLGKKAAAITLACDILKAALAVELGIFATGNRTVGYLCLLMVFAGHIFPVFYRFKGGKGVAAAFGGVLMIDWRIALICLAVCAVLTVLTKRMSVGSIAGAFALPILAKLFEPRFMVIALIVGLIIILKHRKNIERLVAGEEPPMSIFERKEKK